MEYNAKERDVAGTALLQFISFTVGDEEFGLELPKVREVIRIRQITWLPNAPSFVKGVINLRGDVIPIVDLRDRFGLPSREADADTRVIIVEIEGRLIGMVVDAASQVVRIPAARIDPPPRFSGSLSQDFIAGVGKLDDRLVILLKVDRVLSGDERTALRGLDPIEASAEPASAVA